MPVMRASSLETETAEDPAARVKGPLRRILWPLAAVGMVLVRPARVLAEVARSRSFVWSFLLYALISEARWLSICSRVGVSAVVTYGMTKAPAGASDALLRRLRLGVDMYLSEPLWKKSLPMLAWLVELAVISAIFVEVKKRIWRDKTSFGEVFSTASYSLAPQTAFAFVGILIVWLFPRPETLSIPYLLKTSVGMLFHPASLSPFARATLGEVDVWQIWTWVLFAIGIAGQRTQWRRSLAWVFGISSLFVVGEGIMTAAMSWWMLNRAH